MLGLVRTQISYGVPVWQDDPDPLQGGFTLDITGLVVGSVLPAGTPLSANEATRYAVPLLTATVYANASAGATAYQVKKGQGFVVGANVALTVGGAAYPITIVDTSNAAFDTITVSTTLGAATAGDSLFKSSATGATAGAYSATVRGLLYEDTTVVLGADVAVIVSGMVYERRIPVLPAAIKALIPNMIFSQSY